MNFKKIIALVCAVALISTNASAFTPFLPEDMEQSQEESTGVKAEDNASEEPDSEAKAEADSETKSETDSEAKAETDSEAKAETDSEAKAEADAEKETKADTEKETEAEAETQAKSEEKQSSNKPPVSGIYKPNDIYYRLFKQILDAYVENHLYDFTHEEVMYKFFYDFLTDNPMYFKYMTNYMLGTMDPYSSYHDASSDFLKGDVVSTGFGIMIEEDEKGHAVVGTVFEESNAQKAGILPGDKFVSVMGFKVDDLPIDATTTIIANISHFIPAEQMPKDEEDVEYSFEFLRNGEIVPIKVHKGTMVSGSIDSYTEMSGKVEVGVITLASFLGNDTDKKFAEIVSDFHSRGITHLTIDLRDNGGGNLDYALSMAECFVPNGELLCYYNDKTLEEPRAIYSTTEGLEFDSVAILVNEHTASAAELFSRILHVKGIAKLIGTPTFGKGIGQTIYTLINGDYITITSYEILDQNKENYNGIGLKPDLEIDNTEVLYELPELGWFNHENYKEIKEGQYSDVTKALEDRLVIANLLSEEHCDGIFDDTTKRAVYALQLYVDITPTGVLDDATVTGITKLINAYKNYTYYEDSPYEVSLYMHRSFSQGKRRLAEIQKQAEKEQKKIDEHRKALEEALDKEDEEKDEAQDSPSSNSTSSSEEASQSTVTQEADSETETENTSEN